MERLIRRWWVIALFVLVPGCLGLGKPKQPAIEVAKPTPPKQVKTGGACIELGQGHQPAYSVEEFVDKAAELLAAKQVDTAREFVGLYPDLCQEALRRASTAEGKADALQLIAVVHDEQAGLEGTALSWSRLIQDRVAKPGDFVTYDTARHRAAELIRDGRAAEVPALKLAKCAPHALLEVDAHRLTGEALLQAGKPGDAVGAFAAAMKQVQTAYPYQAAQIMFLLGEAHRRAAHIEQAAGTWQQAVIGAAALKVRDPILWETAAYVRPSSTAWPDPVLKAMMPAGAVSRTSGANEAWLWKRLGDWRLDRGEPQAALIAFKRAEAMAVESNQAEDLQLLQAQALAQLGQGSAAAALLAPLVDKPRPAVAAAALATLGALKLQANAAPQAVAFLKKSLELGQNAHDWPGRADAEADLGLAQLLTGDVNGGMNSLHSAQKRFESTHNTRMLRQCLENEAAYWRKAGKPTEADKVLARLPSPGVSS